MFVSKIFFKFKYSIYVCLLCLISQGVLGQITYNRPSEGYWRWTDPSIFFGNTSPATTAEESCQNIAKFYNALYDNDFYGHLSRSVAGVSMIEETPTSGRANCTFLVTADYMKPRTSVDDISGYFTPTSKTYTSVEVSNSKTVHIEAVPAACGKLSAGNPIDIMTGAKKEHSIDYVMPGTNGINFERFYFTEQVAKDFIAGKFIDESNPNALGNWTHNWSTRLEGLTNNSSLFNPQHLLRSGDGIAMLRLRLPNGSKQLFIAVSGSGSSSNTNPGVDTVWKRLLAPQGCIAARDVLMPVAGAGNNAKRLLVIV